MANKTELAAKLLRDNPKMARDLVTELMVEKLEISLATARVYYVQRVKADPALGNRPVGNLKRGRPALIDRPMPAALVKAKAKPALKVAKTADGAKVVVKPTKIKVEKGAKQGKAVHITVTEAKDVKPKTKEVPSASLMPDIKAIKAANLARMKAVGAKVNKAKPAPVAVPVDTNFDPEAAKAEVAAILADTSYSMPKFLKGQD